MKTNSGFSEEPFQLIRLMTKSMSSREKWFPGIRWNAGEKKELDKVDKVDKSEDKVEGFVSYGDGVNESIEATQALTFMVHGLTSRIKIPLAYYHLASYHI